MKQFSFIQNFLQQYTDKQTARFHMPGHKGGLGFDALRWEADASYDITEISGADNLLQPDGIIYHAQNKAAEAYNAQHTFFLTGGSTSGILAILLSFPRGTKILVGRDCHKSVISGLILADLVPTFIDPYFDRNYGRYTVLTPDIVQEALMRYPNHTALWLTRPNYDGNCADIAKIAKLCDDHKVALLVDEAHGAHYPFSNNLPKSAAQYADAWVNSAHKTLYALNQAAYLHLGKQKRTSYLTQERVAHSLSLVHTTSPSYPVLSSLEYAWQSASQGIWGVHVNRLLSWENTLPAHWAGALQCSIGDQERDCTRLTFHTDLMQYNGYEVERFLYKKGIFVEMADAQQIVAITSPCDPDIWYERLSNALASFSGCSAQTLSLVPFNGKLVQEMGLREAALGPQVPVPIECAAGRIAAQCAGIYPPGIALVTPGERITRDLVTHMLEMKARGARLFGVPILCSQKG